MKIININTNSHNPKTTFRAKLQLEGDINNTPKDFINNIYNEIKEIGTNNDIVSIKFDKETSLEESWSEMGHRYTANRYRKNINVASFINGKLSQNNFAYISNLPGKQNYEYLQTRLIDWLKSLNNN